MAHETGTRKRPPYDTQSFTRSFIDISQAIVLGAFLTAAHVACLRFELRYAALLIAPLLYFAVIVCSDRSRFIPPLIFSASLLIGAGEKTELVRILVFAAFLCLVPNRRQSILPFYVLCGLWTAFLLVNTGLGSPLMRLDSAHVWVMLTEIVALLGLHFLAWTGRFTVFFRRIPPVVHAGAVLAALSLVTAASTSLILIAAFLASFGISLERFTDQALINWRVWLPVLAGLLCISTTIGVALHRLVRLFVDHIRAVNSGQKLGEITPIVPRIAEFEESLRITRHAIEKFEREAKGAQQSLKELLFQRDSREREVREREDSARNLERLINEAPLGYLAVSGTGSVILTNQRLFEIFCMAPKPLVGEHFSQFGTEHPWRKELISILTWAIKEQKELMQRPNYRCYTSCLTDEYVEITLKVAAASDARIQEIKRSQHLAPSDIVIMAFARRLPDLRDFQLRNLNPSTREMSGTQALEVCRELSVRLQAFDHRVRQSASAIRETSARTRPSADTEIFLKAVETFAKESVELVDGFLEKIAAPPKSQVQLDLAPILQHAVDYLYDLLALDERVRLRFELDEEDDKRALILVNKSNLAQFLRYYLAFIQSILPKAGELDLALAYEHIGSGTATLVPGSRPGQYLRLTLSHAGQSIPANIAVASIRSLPATVDEIGLPDVSLALLTHQIRVLGGFLSLQSSAQRGTQLTIYMPEDPYAAAELIRPRRQRDETAPQPEPAPAAEETRHSAPSAVALAVGENEEILSRLEEFLKTIRLGMKVCRWNEALETSQDEIVSGAGFDDAAPGIDVEPEISPEFITQVPLFRIVFLLPEDSTALKALAPAVATKAPTIIVSEQQLEDELGLPRIAAPFSRDELSDALEKAASVRERRLQAGDQLKE